MKTTSEKVQEVLRALDAFKEENYVHAPKGLTREQSEDFLHYFFENNAVVYFRHRQHLLLLNEVLRKAKYLRHGTKKKVFALIYLNYTLSAAEKTALYARFKLNKTAQEKTLMVSLLITTEPDLLKQKIRRPVLNQLLSSVEKTTIGDKDVSLYLGQTTPRNQMGFSWEKKTYHQDTDTITIEVPEVSSVEKAWAINQCLIIKFFKARVKNLKMYERTTFYLRYYGIDFVKNFCETEKIVDTSNVLVLIFEHKVQPVCDKKTADLIFKTYQKDVKEYVLNEYPLLENFEGLTSSVPKLVGVHKQLQSQDFNVFEFKNLLKGKRLKNALESWFGFHSSTLISFLKEKAKELSPVEFVELLARGLVAKNLLGSDQVDYNWRFLNLCVRKDMLYFLQNRGSNIKDVFTKEQLLLVFENSKLETNKRNQISNLQFLQDSAYQLLPEVVQSLKELPFNDINNLQKFHDISTREYSKFKHKPFDLELSKKYPTLPSLEGQKLPKTELSLKLPKSNVDLIYWGKVLRNCVGSYADEVKSGHCLILGFYEGDLVKYCIELVRTEDKKIAINQFKGHLNENAPRELFNAFQEWLPETLIQEFLEVVPAATPRRRNPILMMFGDQMEVLVDRARRAGPLPDIDIEQIADLTAPFRPGPLQADLHAPTEEDLEDETEE